MAFGNFIENAKITIINLIRDQFKDEKEIDILRKEVAELKEELKKIEERVIWNWEHINTKNMKKR